MAEALEAVKAEFGDAAVLLRTRALDPRVDRRSGFEVTAAHEPEPLARPPRGARGVQLEEGGLQEVLRGGVPRRASEEGVQRWGQQAKQALEGAGVAGDVGLHEGLLALLLSHTLAALSRLPERGRNHLARRPVSLRVAGTVAPGTLAHEPGRS